MANIKTRIQLRNDQFTNWEKSDKTLLKGEVALAKMENGKYEVRIGDGHNKYLNSDQIQISASQVVGLEQTITSLSTSFFEVSALTDITTKPANGSIAVVTADIDGTHTSYTAYYYDTSLYGGTWRAMDGNYSAENVYFPSNMTMTYAFGKYTVPSSGSYTLNCKGQSVQAMINDAFAETKSGTVSKPTFTFTTSSGTGEIGTTYNVPAATLKMTDAGTYQYDPKDANCSVEIGDASVSASFMTAAKTNASAIKENNTLVTDTGATGVTYLSGGTSYVYTASATYTDGVVPKNNIGGDDPASQIKSDTYTNQITATFTGYYPAYWGFSTTPTANPTAITANNANTITVDGVSMTRDLNSFSKTSFATSNKWYELFYIVPACKRSSSGWKGKDSNNVDLAVEARTEATVTFKDGSTAKYYVYVVRNAAIYSATTCTMTFV